MDSGTNTSKGFFDVTVCEPDNLVGPASQFDTYSCNPSESAGDPGDYVAVVVEYNHPLIVPVISSIVPQIRLTAQRESTVETFREVKSEEGPGSDPPAPQPSLTPPSTTTVEPPAYDYCANIDYSDTAFYDVSRGYHEMWRFGLNFFNNNDISMWLTEYMIDWAEGQSTIDLKSGHFYDFMVSPPRVRAIVGQARTGPAYCYTTASDPSRHCDPNSNIEIPSRLGCPAGCVFSGVHNTFCKDYNDCDFSMPQNPWTQWTNQPITGSNYNISATFEFTFYPDGQDPVECIKTVSASGLPPPLGPPSGGGGGGGGYNPTPPPTPGGGGGGGDPTPDPDPPGD